MAVMGRPKSDNPKVKNVTIRMTKDVYEEIASFASEHDQTMTKTLLDGFDLLKQKEVQAER